MDTSPWDPEGVESILDTEGRASETSDQSSLDVDNAFRGLVAARALDLRITAMGLPAWASAAGEEAVHLGVASTMAREDWVYPGERDTCLALLRGVDYEEIARQLLGHDASESCGRNRSGQIVCHDRGIACGTETLGMHLALATGHAHAQKLETGGAITFALLGEGSTTLGLFHESIAMAVNLDLPLVLVCKSQLWPAGAPQEAGLLGDPVSDRVRSCGMWSRRSDGADVLGVHAAISAAATRAREGHGPSLVEVVVTQLQHDPPAHRDPLERLRLHLDLAGKWSPAIQSSLEKEFRDELEAAITRTQETHA